MKTLAIIQARLSSQRLPGKVLLPLGNAPMLYRQVERVRYCKNINYIVVATSVEPEDDAIIEMCQHYKIDYYRGSLNDVVDRFYRCGLKYNADAIVRLTGDCPLSHYSYIDDLIKAFYHLDFAYLTNGSHKTWNTPDGFDCEIMTKNVLFNIWRYSVEREHLTKYLWGIRNPDYGCIKLSYNWPYHQKLSVDTYQDYLKVKKIFETLYFLDHNFGLEQIKNYVG